MSDEREVQPTVGKTDWSRTEALSGRSSSEKQNQGLVPVEGSSEVEIGGHSRQTPTIKDVSRTLKSLSPEELEIESRDWLTRWKAGGVNKQALIEELKARHKGHLDMVKHFIAENTEVMKHAASQTLRARKSQIDVQVEEYIKQLDASHLSVLAELGLKNVDTRLAAVHRLGDLVAAAVKKMTEADWPEHMKQKAINDAFALHDREHAKFMEELGGKY